MEASLNSDDLVDRGEAHHQAGQLQEAESYYQQALQVDPTHPGALYFLASIAYDDQRFELATRLIETLLRDESNDAEAWHLRGMIAVKQENFPHAAESFKRALTIEPNYAMANYSLGDLYSRQGNIEGAITSFQKAASLQPDFAEAFCALGNAYRAQKRFDEAVSNYQQAVLLKSNFELAYQNLGEILCLLGRSIEAIKIYRTAIAENPHSSTLLVGLGAIFAHENQDEEAIANFERAIALDVNSLPAHSRLADLFMKMGRIGEAVTALQKAHELDPTDSRLLVNLSKAYRDVGRLNDAIDCARKAVTVDPNFAVAHNSLLSLSQYFADSPREKNYADHLAFGERFAITCKKNRFQYLAKIDSKKRLRIGFVSGDLRRHPVGYFFEGVVQELFRRNNIDIVVYSTNSITDDVTDRLRAVTHEWTLVSELSDDEFEQRIRLDQIDILVDLSGHTAYNRLLVFARKPAPVQVTWLGYWETTGLQSIDYILCDRYGIHDDEIQYFVEKPWFLPHTRLCFTPPTASISIGSLPALSIAQVTFGCFNDLVKMTDRVVAVWARILNEVPNSRLMLKSKAIAEPDVQKNIIERFAVHGVSANRLVLQNASPYLEYLATYNQIDIALDPFPFPGGTTSVQGLWMGVPMITMKGDRIISRQGEAILHNLGLADWIANNEDDYVRLAVNHAADLTALSTLRMQLRERLERSPLCNAQAFAQDIESAFVGMWESFRNVSAASDPIEFVDVVADAALAEGLPTRAIDYKARRSKPMIVVAAAPKSGSTFLSNVINRVTDLPYSRLSSAYATNEHDLYLPALHLMNNRGCVSQLHIKGTFHNAALMKTFSIKPIILVRDIQDTIVSLADDLRAKEKMEGFGSGQNGFSFLWQDHAIAGLNQEALIDCIIDLAIPWYVNFYASWYRLCARGDVDAMWITYEEMMKDKKNTIANVLDHVGFGKDIFIDDAVLGLRFSKFNSGESGRGDKLLSDHQKSRLKQLFSYYPDIDFSRYGIRS